MAAIAGIAGGGFVLLVVIIGGGVGSYFLWRRSQKLKKKDEEEAGPNVHQTDSKACHNISQIRGINSKIPK